MTATSDEDVLAIDIGGTKIALAIASGGTLSHRTQIATPRTGAGADLVDAIGQAAAQMPAAAQAAIATTGIVDNGHLTALNPATLPVEDRFPLAGELKARLGLPTFVLNDAQAAAWAEFRVGAPAERMIFVTVSTGIGAGIVLDGKLQTGVHGLAGHVGHMVGDPSGPVCGCGRTGCVERLASGTAIGAIASERLGRKVSAPEVFALAEDGDQACLSILRQSARSLAGVLCDVVASLDIDVIVIGGGVGLADGFVGLVRAAIEQQPAIFRRHVVKAVLGADAGLVGVSMLANDGNFHR